MKTVAHIYDNPSDKGIDAASNFDCYDRHYCIQFEPCGCWHTFAFKRRCDAARWAKRNGYDVKHWYAI